MECFTCFITFSNSIYIYKQCILANLNWPFSPFPSLGIFSDLHEFPLWKWIDDVMRMSINNGQWIGVGICTWISSLIIIYEWKFNWHNLLSLSSNLVEYGRLYSDGNLRCHATLECVHVLYNFCYHCAIVTCSHIRNNHFQNIVQSGMWFWIVNLWRICWW